MGNDSAIVPQPASSPSGNQCGDSAAIPHQPQRASHHPAIRIACLPSLTRGKTHLTPCRSVAYLKDMKRPFFFFGYWFSRPTAALGPS